MKRIRIYLLLVLLFPLISFSQSIDSLKIVLEHQKHEDTSKVNTLCTIATAFHKTRNYDDSFEYIKQGISIGEKINYKKGLAVLYAQNGDYLNYTGNYALALKEYFKSLEIETMSSNRIKMAEIQQKLGNLYAATKQYYIAVSNYKEGLDLYRQMNDTLGQVKVLIASWKVHTKYLRDSISAAETLKQLIFLINHVQDDSISALTYSYAGKFYYEQGNVESAVKYYTDALHINEKLNNVVAITNNYDNIGTVYESIGNNKKALEWCLKMLPYLNKTTSLYQKAKIHTNLGWAYMLVGDYKKALEHQLASYKFLIEDKDERNIYYPLGNLGIIYNHLGEYQKAVDYTMLALNLCIKHNEQVGIVEAYNNMGLAHYHLKEYTKSLESLNKALRVAKENDIVKERKDVYFNLSNTYKKLGDYKDAFESYMQFVTIRDSLHNQEHSLKINSLVSGMESERKNKEYALLLKDTQLQEIELKKQRIIIYCSVVGFLLAVLLVFFISRGYNRKRKHNFKLLKSNAMVTAQKQEITEMYNNVKLLSKIGQEITSCLTVEKLIETTYENINQIVDASFMWIGVYDRNRNWINFPLGFEKGQRLYGTRGVSISETIRLPVWTFLNQKEIIMGDYANEYTKYIISLSEAPTPVAGEIPGSCIWMPLLSKDKKSIGVFSIQSMKKFTYNEYQINLVRNLVVFIAIALENVNAYNNKE